ncbi:hypothetical protein LEMLEM_LOCUS15884, partial [Lemmus lemmus]
MGTATLSLPSCTHTLLTPPTSRYSMCYLGDPESC